MTSPETKTCYVDRLKCNLIYSFEQIVLAFVYCPLNEPVFYDFGFVIGRFLITSS